MNKEVDIVIISYAKNETCYNLTKNCLESLYDSEKDIKFNVFVVESEEGVSWDIINPDIVTVKAPLPYGYHKFLNFGRKLGKSEFVALCNNDLIFKEDWMTNIFEAYEYNPNYYSFSPICPKTQPQYGIKINTGLIFGYDIRKHLSGWCIVQRREIYNLIGDLDESFIHWFCDNDYALSLSSKKIKHMLVTNSIVEHHEHTIGKTTQEVIDTQEDLDKLTTGAVNIFKNKWSGSKF